MAENLPLLVSLTLLAALLYSSVGHGGASGYLAAMALIGVAPATTKPTALVLNILVASVASFRYIRAGCFDFKVFWPFAAGAVPLAFIGGATQAPADLYRQVLGGVLIIAAISLLLRRDSDRPRRSLHPCFGILIGAAIGFVSGLIGIGGGIFLSPILILGAFATTRQTLGISALFILLNSLAGISGHLKGMLAVSIEVAYLAPAAFAGALAGSLLGLKFLPPNWLRIILAAVLALAAAKLLLS